MVDEQNANDGEQGADDAGAGGERLSQADRREQLAELADRIGDQAVQDGDRVVVEAGEPVILHIEIDRDGLYTATWWATALTESGHHRWREVADELTQEGEAIYTSALGGGYLVEVERATRDVKQVRDWAGDDAPVERVRELLARFPEEVGKLPDEPVPDYLLPPEPEVPPLGEAEASEQEESEEQ